MPQALSRTITPGSGIFPPSFRFGVATSSFQIEGGASARGESIWDALCRVPGAIADGSDGRTACDHLNRWAEDLDLASDLGARVWRFSISWPRVQRGGRGPLVPDGIGFYDRVVDGCLERGLQPFLTLFHWDLPVELQELGGWQNRDTAFRLADMAHEVALRLGDRVADWATINEGPCIVDMGHGRGEHAPALRLNPPELRAVRHHVLLAHGLCVRALRGALPPDRRVVLVHNPFPIIPATTDPADIPQAREATRRANQVWFDPLFAGTYPAEDEPAARIVHEGDLEIIGSPIDLLGVNAYMGFRVAAGGEPFKRDEAATTDFQWVVEPEILYWLPRFLMETWKVPPMMITENGCAWEVGGLDDHHRVAFLHDHLAYLSRALDEKIPIEGYLAWSLLDNFEWAMGYTMRFGLVHVDFESQKRTPKASWHWYRDLCHSGQLPPTHGVELP